MSANILHMIHLLNGEKTFFAASVHQSLCVTGALIRIMCMYTGGRKKKKKKPLSLQRRHVALSAEASER